MKSKKYLFFTLKKQNKTKNNIHDLLIKSGIIRKLCSGLYSWMPTGLKIINKVKSLIRIKMFKINALEINMPILQPKKIWEISNRINLFKSELISVFNNKSFILSPTNEEMITYIIKNEIQFLYKKLPITLFQIQNKFRNEIRPFGGIIRTKEFIMKDAYSFHYNSNSLNLEYKKFKKCYSEIFNELNLKYYIIKTKSDLMNCKFSHEFHIESKYGNNNIIICKKTNKTEFLKNSYNILNENKLNPKENFKIIDYKYISNKNILEKKILKNKLLKVIIFYSKFKSKSKFIALVMRYYDNICIKKLKNINKIQFPFKIANNNDIIEIFGYSVEFLGILNLNIPVIVDYRAMLISDFVTSLNINKKFAFGVNWNKSIKIIEIVDISYEKHENLSIKKTIEIAHIFKLNNTYIKKFNIKKKILMGCYGIGISRIIFSIFEKNFKKELILPYNVSPFSIAIIPINMKNSNIVKNITNKLYIKLINNNFDVLLDNRINKSFGYIINDIILLGIPIILIINEKKLKLNLIEIKNRYKNQNFTININNIFKYLNKEIKK